MMDHWTIIIAIAFLLLVLGVTGNSAVIYVFGWEKRKHQSRQELMLFLLGVVDFVCSISLPTILITSILGGINYETYFSVCKLAPVLVVGNVTVSQCLLILICYDRYKMIVKQFEDQVSKRQIFLWLVASIVLATVSTIPLTMVLDLGETEPYQKCLVDITRLPYKIAVSVIFLVRDVTAVLMMVFFMKKIMATLNESSNFRAGASIEDSSKGSLYYSIRRVLVTVIVANLCCIVPMDTFKFMFFIVIAAYPSLQVDWNFALIGFTYLQLLQILNSVVNGFVYAALHPDFGVLRDKLCSCRYQQEDSKGTHRELIYQGSPASSLKLDKVEKQECCFEGK